MPSIPYPGSKARLAGKIVSFLPKNGRTYIEPFAGKGNIFWAAASQGLEYRDWWLNDFATARFFHAIRQIGHSLKVPTRSRAEFERQREKYKSGDLTAILLEAFLSFSGGGYFEAGCRGGGGCGEDDGGISAKGYSKAIRECHAIIQKTKPRITNLDWRKMGLESLTEEDVVVFDPPYPNSNVRSYSEHSVDYESLVDLLLRAKFRWILCGYPHPVLCRLGKPILFDPPALLLDGHTKVAHPEPRRVCGLIFLQITTPFLDGHVNLEPSGSCGGSNVACHCV